MKHFVHIELSKIRRAHYRRCVAVMLVTVTGAHIFIPEHEHWINLMANIVWLFDPTES